MTIKYLFRFKYQILFLLFIVINISSLNNLPWGDDYSFVFNSNIKEAKSLFVFWNPFSNYFKSWPLSYSALWLIFKIFGSQHFWFRIINLLIHLINTYLVRKISSDYIQSNNKNLIVFAVTTCFLFHPMSQFTINWIFQLKTLLSMFFCLITIYGINNISKNQTLYSFLAIISFFLALNAKIAVVALPIYLVFKLIKSPYKVSHGITLGFFLLLSTYYGLINIKGINAIWAEKKNVTRSIVDYKQDTKTVKAITSSIDSNLAKYEEKPKSKPKSQPHKNPDIFDKDDNQENIIPFKYKKLQEELITSLNTLSIQIFDRQKLIEKIGLNIFTFGRYIAASLGLNIYSIVYERNIESFRPILFFSYCFITFFYCYFFFRKDNFYSILLCILFFIPIGGLFYVPYMKISFISDHWFYLSLPFFLIATFNYSHKKVIYGFTGIILIQSLYMSYQYRSSESIITHSYNAYNSTFTEEYLARLAMEVEDFHFAYSRVKKIANEDPNKRINIIRTQFILNMSHILNENLWQDTKDYIAYLIDKKKTKSVPGIMQRLANYTNPKEEVLIQSLIKIRNKHFSRNAYERTMQIMSNDR